MQSESAKRLLASPSFSATLYLAAIPVFASIYQDMWTDLRQSTSSSDAVTQRLAADVTDLFYPAMLDFAGLDVGIYSKNIVPRPPDVEGPLHGADGDIVYVWSVFTEREGEFLGCTIRFNIDTATLHTEKGVTLAESLIRIAPASMSELYITRLRKGDALASFEMTSADASAGVIGGTFTLGDGAAVTLEDYLLAREGLPIRSEGGFGRFLYFSVVTITTLGYGDIVPVTDRARAVVGAQSMFGVVIAGLFINAVGRKRQGA